MMNTMILKEEILTDEELDVVSGGAGFADAIVAGLDILKDSMIGGVKQLRELVNSTEYSAMSNLGKEKAIGKILANNLCFNSVIQGAIGIRNPLAGVAAVPTIQVKYRTVGCCATVRKGVEKIWKV